MYIDSKGLENIGMVSSGAGIWIIISLVAAIVGGIVLYFTVFADKEKEKYKGVMAYIYGLVKFDKMLVSTLLKVLYLVFAIYITLSSFAFIGQNFLAFILTLILGNIVLRIGFEFSMILIGIWENTKEIAKNTKK